jgi:hypothetical protein
MEHVNTAHEMRALVNDPDDPTPVVALLKPNFSHQTDHAVVVLGFENNTAGGDSVVYMDPQFGQITLTTVSEFMYYWEFTNRDAFVISS